MFKQVLIALGFVLAGSAALAQNSIQVSATVSAVCNVTASPLAFGAYNPLVATPTDASTTVAIECSKGSVPKIELNTGLYNASGRRMKHASSADYLAYSIYQPADNTVGAACAYSTAWGAGAGALTTTAAPSIASRSYNVCGRIGNGQDVPVGSYADTVAVTIAF
ncbi:MAG: spore coat U domain-containing protein [Ramlibacter sp.]